MITLWATTPETLTLLEDVRVGETSLKYVTMRFAFLLMASIILNVPLILWP